MTYPKDPADRIIGATVLVEGLSLLTADPGIRHSRAIQAIWQEPRHSFNQQNF
jgi:PIN domain nuclease of toxin-antitoxin system